MKPLRLLLSAAVMSAMLITAFPAYAIFAPSNSIEGSLTPRGFRRGLSTARDARMKHCQHIDDNVERRQCFVKYKNQRHTNPLSKEFEEREMEAQKRGQRCGHLTNVAEWRACTRGKITGTQDPDGKRVFSKRNSRRKAKEQIEKCALKENPQDKLRCLQSQGNKRTSKVKLMRRNRLVENMPVDFISPNGLRRNLSRSRDLIKEECGEIRNGNDKRACIKRIKEQYEGF